MLRVMTDAKQVLQSLGREAVKSALGVKQSAIYAAEGKGVFPAAWFDAPDSMGASQGVSVPRTLFNWKHASEDGEERRDDTPL
ncbi:hypothetical protein PSE_3019 [Pseudovibrio sp. FO-BEG1]|nr:hypothetical protein PSE_3019 [Pseudovibrio sp. FO-BEG1]